MAGGGGRVTRSVVGTDGGSTLWVGVNRDLKFIMYFITVLSIVYG